jgi:glutamate/tyrosine decarboxylase-like PLP-dependent enzyme
VSLNIVCFRYAPSGLGQELLDEVNREILMRVQERGIAVPSSTRLGGRLALRVAISNQRSRRADFDTLVEAVLRIGDEVVSGVGA